MAQPRKPKSISVADKLATKLQNAIDSGKLTIGSSLPSERELMTKYQVSRTTVREALRVLGAQGLIEVKRGRSGGSFISSPTAHSVVRSLDLFIKGQNIRFVDLVFVRQAIEPAAAAQAATSRSLDKLERLRQQCVECENSVKDVHRFVNANLKWHLDVAEASENPLFVTFLSSISPALHTATDLEVFDEKTRKIVAGVHWQIFEAIRVGDPEAARRRMIRHLTAYGEKLSATDLSVEEKAAAEGD
jgi:GntR family transcriptional regulator, transcriptional repressor for pyruvate dehydrogenase complex